MDHELPDEYTRVTDPGRYNVLQDAADEMLDDLERRFAVERRDTKETLREDGELLRFVRLMPRTPAAAPLAIAFTDFPGVVLRLGRWFEQALPACGCDACGEEPPDLVMTMRARVSALVEGGLWERVRRGMTGSWAETRLIGPEISDSRKLLLDARDARAARRDGFGAAVQWAPWTLRA